MTQVVHFFITFYQKVLALLDSITFELMGYEVSYLSVIFVFLVLGLVITVLWRGAKT